MLKELKEIMDKNERKPGEGCLTKQRIGTERKKLSKRNQVEILEIKSTITEMKNSLTGLNSSSEEA